MNKEKNNNILRGKDKQRDEDSFKESILDKISKKQLISVTIGIVSICVLLSLYFIYSGREAMLYEEDLLSRIEELIGINATLQDNNKVLKNTLKANTSDHSEEATAGALINEDVEVESDITAMTDTEIGMAYPDYLDDISKDYLDRSYFNSNVLVYAYKAKLKSEGYPYGYGENAELKHIHFIDQKHCFVQIVQGSISKNIIYKIDDSDGEIKFEELSSEQVDSEVFEDARAMNLIDHLSIRSTFNIQTLETSHTQIFDSRFMGGRISPDGKFAMHLTIDNRQEDDYEITATLVNMETRDVVAHAKITNYSTGAGKWKSDSSRVLIDEHTIYDVEVGEFIFFDTMDQQNAVFGPQSVTIDNNIVVTKDYIGVMKIYDIRETNKSQLYLHVYDWDGNFSHNILITENDTPTNPDPVYLPSSVVSNERNIIVVEPQGNISEAFIINLDTGDMSETQRNRMYIPDLEWYASFYMEIINQEPTEIVEFYDLNDQLMLTTNTGEKRVESYFGKDPEEDVLYFRRYTDNGFSDITAINYVTGEYSEIVIPIEKLSEDSSIFPYAYDHGTFELLEVIRTRID